jgi:hypothetical protein
VLIPNRAVSELKVAESLLLAMAFEEGATTSGMIKLELLIMEAHDGRHTLL